MNEFIQYNVSPENFYIYSRVSSNHQATDSNHGLDSQKLICKKYLKNIFEFDDQKLQSMVDYYSDIGSSYSNPKALYKLNLLLKNLKKDSLILISEISRLGRNVHQVINMLKKIEDKNCWIISVTEGLCFNKSKLMNKQFYQKIIDAERESDLISMRTTNAYKVIKEKGGFIGKAPFGKKKVKVNGITQLVDNLEEINIIKLTIELYQKYRSYSNVAKKLNDDNIKKRNLLWTTYSVAYTIKKNYKIISSSSNHSVIDFFSKIKL